MDDEVVECAPVLVDYGVETGEVGDVDVVLFEEEFELLEVVLAALDLVGVVEGVHLDAAGVVAGEDFCDEEAIGEVPMGLRGGANLRGSLTE